MVPQINEKRSNAKGIGERRFLDETVEDLEQSLANVNGKRLSNLKIFEVGLIARRQKPALATSPDGLAFFPEAKEELKRKLRKKFRNRKMDIVVDDDEVDDDEEDDDASSPRRWARIHEFVPKHPDPLDEAAIDYCILLEIKTTTTPATKSDAEKRRVNPETKVKQKYFKFVDVKSADDPRIVHHAAPRDHRLQVLHHCTITKIPHILYIVGTTKTITYVMEISFTTNAMREHEIRLDVLTNSLLGWIYYVPDAEDMLPGSDAGVSVEEHNFGRPASPGLSPIVHQNDNGDDNLGTMIEPEDEGESLRGVIRHHPDRSQVERNCRPSQRPRLNPTYDQKEFALESQLDTTGM